MWRNKATQQFYTNISNTEGLSDPKLNMVDKHGKLWKNTKEED